MHAPTSSPQRTLLGPALALAAGSLLGSSALVAPGAALGLGFVLLCGGAFLRAGGARRGALLAAVALCATARAATLSGAAPPGTTLPGAAPPAAVQTGRWQVRELDAGHEQAAAGTAQPTCRLAAGAVEDGARVELAAGAARKEPATGPCADPRQARPVAPSQALVRELLPDEVLRLEAGADFLHLARALARLRSSARARLEAIPDAPTRGLACALLLGDTALLTPEEQDLFVRTGTYHLLVVSGTQVVLLSWLVFAPLAHALSGLVGFLGARARAELLLVPLVALYVPLAGGDAPVLRAALVFALVPFAPRSRALGVARRCDGLTLWSAALAVECLWNPCAAASLSVELSYAATLSLITCSGPLLARLQSALGPPGLASVDALGRARPWILRLSSSLASRAARRALVASCVAVIATAPLVLSRFGELCPSGVLSTVVLLVPTTLLLVAAALVAFVGAPLPAGVLIAPAHACGFVARAFDALPLSPWSAPARPFLAWAALALLLLAALRGATPLASSRPLRAAALLAGLLLLPWTRAPAAAEVVALDVGHGTSVCVREVDGSAWIFDAGSRDRSGVGRGALLPLVAAWEPGELVCVLSDAQRDHDGALPWVAERLAPSAWVGAEPAHSGERFPHALRRFDLPGPGALELPARPGSRAWLLRGSCESGNEGSRTLVLEEQGELLWFAGDAEEQGLAGTLEAWQRAARPVRMLLLPHHGSDLPRLSALLERLRPREVWISSSEWPPASAELERRGLDWRWTGAEGPLCLDLAPP